jgi:hypothetical protein
LWIVESDGRRSAIGGDEIRQIFGVVRSEMDFQEYAPPALCRRHPNIVAVISQRGTNEIRWACR